MYIAMNQFRIHPEHTADFERAWRERESYLDDVPGFNEFRLLRGPEEEGAVLYSSHTTWSDEASFVAWTQSEAFRKAHGQARMPDGVVLGPPRFFGWQSVDLET